VTATDVLVERNRSWSADQAPSDLPIQPRLHVAVVTCMDSRLDLFDVLGLAPGEAHVLRNAGGIVTDDVVRSLAISQRKLGTREVVLVHHTDCGMQKITDDGFRAELQAASGVAPSFAIETFTDLEEDVAQSVRRVRRSAFLLYPEAVRGFVHDVATHELREVVVPGRAERRERDLDRERGISPVRLAAS
jgi:carbonic anhydrase